MINSVSLLGRLGNDPEMSFTPNGNGVCKFTLATTKKWKNQAGTIQEQVSWHRIEAWGKTAEICSEYLKKGHMCFIEGELKYTESEKNGEKRYFTAINCLKVHLLEKKPVDQAIDAIAQHRESPSDNSQWGGTGYDNTRPNDQWNTNTKPLKQPSFADDEIPF